MLLLGAKMDRNSVSTTVTKRFISFKVAFDSSIASTVSLDIFS